MSQAVVHKSVHSREDLLVAVAAAGANLNQFIALGVDHTGIAQAMRVLDGLKRKVRKSITLVFEASETSLRAISNLEIADKDSFVRAQLWQWALKNNMTTACIPGGPCVLSDSDPWLNNAAASIAHWHRVAAAIRDLHVQDPGRLLLGLFAPWSASKRGVSYSLPYVGAGDVKNMSYFVGNAKPISRVHGVAQFDFDLLI